MKNQKLKVQIKLLKLLLNYKALKDDEAAVTQAFMSIENATGFNDNLEYVPEEPGTLLENARNLQDADAILMNNVAPLQYFKSTVLDVNKIVFSGGVSDTVNIGSVRNNGYQIAIPYEGNCTNVTYRFPPQTHTQSHDQYYTMSSIISTLGAELVPPLIAKGRVITFETSDKNWEWWQYVGPTNLSSEDWQDPANWKQLDIQYLPQQ